MSELLYIPRGTECLGGMDWGMNSPGCILWVAALPDTRLHVVREWKFSGLVDEAIAAGYHQRTKALGLTVRSVACDPSMFFKDGRNIARGQSRGESLRRAGMPLKPAVNAREDGWARLQSWLAVPTDDDGAPTGPPRLTIDDTCRYLRRTIPAQQSDPHNADDVDTRGDDHGCDALRYVVMSRPSPTVFVRPAPRRGTAAALADDLRARSGTRAIIGTENVR